MANADMDPNDILNRRLSIARIGVIIAFVIVIMIIFANLVMSMGSLFSGGPGGNDNNDGPDGYDDQDGPGDSNPIGLGNNTLQMNYLLELGSNPAWVIQRM